MIRTDSRNEEKWKNLEKKFAELLQRKFEKPVGQRDRSVFFLQSIFIDMKNETVIIYLFALAAILSASEKIQQDMDSKKSRETTRYAETTPATNLTHFI